MMILKLLYNIISIIYIIINSPETISEKRIKNQMSNSPDYDKAISLCGKLKQTPRTGWVNNHVNHPESIADHCMRTAFLAMTLCPPEINQQKVTQMALIHDYGESLIGDITPVDTKIGPEEKLRLESEAWKEITTIMGNNDQMEMLWREMEAGKTPEGQFVKQLDKLEMLIQAEEYENLQPELDLSSFFRNFDSFFTFPTIKKVFDGICSRRQAKQSQ